MFAVFRPYRFPLYFALLGLIATLNACNSSPAESLRKASEDKKRPVPVTVATVRRKTIPIEIFATGNVQARATVAVQSQIDGQLTGVFFQEGQIVKSGQRLFAIDARLAESALQQSLANRSRAIAGLAQAKANLSKAIADVAQARAAEKKDIVQLQKAQADEKRYTFLESQGAISRQQVEQYRTNSEALTASIAADRSAIENKLAAVEAAKADWSAAKAGITAVEAEIDTARVQLSYASIFAPIAGRVGDLKVDRGNLVKANDTANPLVTISQISPIYVTFSIPERLLPQVKQYMAARPLTINVLDSNGRAVPETGRLTFIDSQVNTTTGTIALKAEFVNSSGKLTPGQFVKVALKLTEERNALVIPSKALQVGQRGPFVFAVNADRTVMVKPVGAGIERDGETVITKGLAVGDRVVTEGQFKLAPGAKVKITDGGTR